jgi:hypothetical protein
MCMCVSIFTNYFSRRYVSSLLDPNAYDQRMTLRGTCKTQLQREFPSLLYGYVSYVIYTLYGVLDANRKVLSYTFALSIMI